jgi:hypothetical protein
MCAHLLRRKLLRRLSCSEEPGSEKSAVLQISSDCKSVYYRQTLVSVCGRSLRCMVYKQQATQHGVEGKQKL